MTEDRFPADTTPQTEEQVPAIVDREATIERVLKAVPSGKRSFVTKEYVERLCSISDDPMERESIIGNFVDYSAVLEEGKYGMEHYLEVIRFASFYVWSGGKRIDAYARAFPDRYAAFLATGQDRNALNSKISTFMAGKLAKSILQQIHTPIAILHRSDLYKSIEKLAYLRDNSKNERIQMESSAKLADILDMDSLVNNEFLKTADEKQVSELTAVMKNIGELALMQQQTIQKGMQTTSEAVGQRINLKKDEDGNYVEENTCPKT